MKPRCMGALIVQFKLAVAQVPGKFQTASVGTAHREFATPWLRIQPNITEHLILLLHR